MSTSNFVSRSPSLQFLKLGGSLITDKQHAHTTRLEVLKRLAGEIAAAFDRDPGLRLLLGHGSGSFGHVPAKEFATRQGVRGEHEWHGFTEVWYQASELNRLVIHALHAEGLPAMAFPPSAMVIAQEAKVLSWDLSPLHSALQAGLLPVVYGDVVFDTRRGGTILSTEDLFDHLAVQFNPHRILLAGIEPGVWADYPICKRIMPEITPRNLREVEEVLFGSAATDVTGGMASKVNQSLELVRDLPGLEILIFSGEEPLAVQDALAGENRGTLIHS